VLLIYFPLAVKFFYSGVIISYLLKFIWVLFSINIVLGIFNLLPIPPLDGSKIFSVFLPTQTYFKFTGFRYGFIILIILIYTGLTSNILQPLMTAVYNGYFFAVERIYFFL